MSKLLDKINSDLKDAMRARAEFKLSVLRMMISAIKNKKIELIQNDDLNDEQILDVLKSETKKRRDAVTAYESGNRPDLAETEKKEIEIIEEYMPEQMSDEDLRSIVEELISSSGATSMSDFGKVMGQAMGKVKGLADGDRVSAVVKSILGK